MLLPILLQLCIMASAAPSAGATKTVESTASVTAMSITSSPSRTTATASTAPHLGLFGPTTLLQDRAVNRSADGLFYVTATVNGAPVRFLVDTGATMVVLTPDDARRAGILVHAEHYKASAETANGRTAMARVTLNEVIVGDKRTEGIDAAVVSGNLPVSLLGQNWLSQLNSITIAGDRLIFD